MGVHVHPVSRQIARQSRFPPSRDGFRAAVRLVHCAAGRKRSLHAPSNVPGLGYWRSDWTDRGTADGTGRRSPRPSRRPPPSRPPAVSRRPRP